MVATGLVREFPPLRSLDAIPGNLPGQLTSLVGRAVERDAIADALLASRLVTVTGVGGVGKSRIAIQVALDVASRFQDGAWLCELATAHDDEELAQVVAATLGVLPRPATSLTASILDALRTRELVLVLDNCEHLVEPVGALAEGLLRDCPGVRVLATSREALGVAGEQVWPLSALELPAQTSTVEDIASSPAVQLFVERARAVQPAFVLDEVNAAAVAEICRRLDGIPLAVELAAARVTIMTPTDIAARLDQRFQLLTGGRRSAAERHQTLRAAIEWSYELLEPSERRLFDALGVFPASFGADAVACRRERRGTRSVGRARRRRRARRQVDDPRRRQHRQHPLPDAGDDPDLRPGTTRAERQARTTSSGVTPSTTRSSPRRPTRGWRDPTKRRGANASIWSSTTSGSRSSAA